MESLVCRTPGPGELTRSTSGQGLLPLGSLQARWTGRMAPALTISSPTGRQLFLVCPRRGWGGRVHPHFLLSPSWKVQSAADSTRVRGGNRFFRGSQRKQDECELGAGRWKREWGE